MNQTSWDHKEKLEAADTLARLMSSDDRDTQLALIEGERGGLHGFHVIYDDVRPGEALHGIYRNGQCLLRRHTHAAE